MNDQPTVPIKLVPMTLEEKLELRLALDGSAASRGALGIQRIKAERIRQLEKEGYTPANDDLYVEGDLLKAAVVYAMAGFALVYGVEERAVDNLQLEMWPWNPSTYKPSKDAIRNLEKAGALIAAEIDRLKRKELRESGGTVDAAARPAAESGGQPASAEVRAGSSPASPTT